MLNPVPANSHEKIGELAHCRCCNTLLTNHFRNIGPANLFEKVEVRTRWKYCSVHEVEVLASVDFIRHNNPGISLDDTIAAIHNWSERKNKLFKNEYIQIAYDHLDTFYGESELFAGL